MAFYKLEPFGPVRDNMHAALIANILAESNRDPKKRDEPFGLQDFMFGRHRKSTKRKSDEEIIAAFKSWKDVINRTS